MESVTSQQPALVGRDRELDRLRQALGGSVSGRGSTIIISGEPGIGKTRLMEAFRSHAASQDVMILAGAASSDSVQPFLVFSNALGEKMGTAPFEEQEYTKFVNIFAINHAGMLVAQASSEEAGLDADIFAGMLSAVQNFVRDSFSQSSDKGGLGRLEYGDMKILIEHGQHLFLTTVFRGNEHPDMKGLMKQTLQTIEKKHQHLLENWSGKTSDVAPVQDEISDMANAKFLVRKDLEGVKLENERLRIADAVLECLTAVSKEKPLVLLLEDLHRADESSLFVLSYLARNMAKIPALVIGTARLKENAAMDHALEMMRKEETATELNLGGLEKTCIEEMVDRLYPKNDFPRDFIESVADRCGGNPLFATEFLKNMVTEHNIAEKDGRHKLVNENYSIPDTVEEVIRGRLLRLGPEALSIAEYASCIGREFDRSIATSINTVEDTAQGWEELRESGIVVMQNGNASFCHAMYQETIYSAISQRWKSVHHKSIGEWYEKSHAGNPDEVIYKLARHFSLSREHLKACEYCTGAGDKASSSYAAEQAMSYFTDALQALRLCRGISDAETRESALLERIGDLSMLLGEFNAATESYLKAEKGCPGETALARLKRKMADAQFKLGEYDLMLRLLSEAKALIGDKEDRELGKVLNAESYVRIARGELEQGLSILHAALDMFRKQEASGGDVGNTLRGIGNIHWRRGEYDAAQRHYEMSLDAMEKIDDLRGITAALNNLGLVHADKGEPDAALEYYGKALGAIERTGDKYMMTMVLNNMGLLYADRGKIDIALDYYRRSLELRERIGDKVGIAAVLLNMGNLHINMGLPHRALELFERSLRISSTADEKKNMASALGALGNANSHLGNLDEAFSYLLRAKEMCEEIGERYTLTHVLDNLGLLHLVREDPRQALEHFTRSMELREEMGDRNDLAWTNYEMAHANLKLGNHGLALQYAERSSALAEEMNLGMESGACLLVKGMILRETGQFGDAMEIIERAEKRFASGGHRSLHAEAVYEMAVLNIALGDKEKARDGLDRALAEFKSMGKRLDAEKCRKALNAL